MEDNVNVRAATLADAESIFALISQNADQLIPRSLGNIVESIDRFVVAESDSSVKGCAAYQIHPEIGDVRAAAVEVVSVAVDKSARRRGIGRLLVERIIGDVSRFSPRDVNVLTFAPEFFESLGFERIEKTDIMHKLYTGCINCTKHADPFTCPEIAMKRALNDR